MAEPFKVGDHVRPVGVPEDSLEYDTGRVMSARSGFCLVEWARAGALYEEDNDTIELISEVRRG